MRVIEGAGESILPEAAELADARPLPVPADATTEERAIVTEAQLVVTVGGQTFRPTDAAFQTWFTQLRADLAAEKELERTLNTPIPR
jgi:hypothetical protein